MSDVIELFGEAALRDQGTEWGAIVDRQWCPFLDRKCMKIRKSQPEISIGTCSVFYGRAKRPLVICPFRLLERRQIFIDCLHLLSTHDPGNELHIVPEMWVPGGSVDYFLVSVRDGKVEDFIAPVTEATGRGVFRRTPSAGDTGHGRTVHDVVQMADGHEHSEPCGVRR